MDVFHRGLLGFLAGFTIASGIGLYWIRLEYTKAANEVLHSSEHLTHTALNVTQYLERIAKLEARLDELDKVLITREEVQGAWDSHRKLYEDLYEENLGLRERMWKLEHEIFATRKHFDEPAWAPRDDKVLRLPPVRLV
ncbi:hypothetical protein Malapachy_2205 [Malassezia pachydermatis]|uniref:Uncharacterized protein n=1 Tax=Malassezia pachydermatis TaxID=77020 RepID=A0A0M8MWK8_9BASI|nr:hypothetical protein Malapachy_2205 [Malassezia pachydermatis]KOS15764.1 hypothetical protein Malapachy_2205 [Malassezia pachydermatis]